jgi:rhamnose transport system ATP-binding protein
VVPDSGQIELDGKIIADNSPARAKELGISVIYQQPALFPDLTVAENIALGVEQEGLWRLVDWKRRGRQAMELLSRVGATIDVNSDAGQLTMPEQQLVEIARALGSDARVLIMDEPTASLSAFQERRRMYFKARLDRGLPRRKSPMHATQNTDLRRNSTVSDL